MSIKTIWFTIPTILCPANSEVCEEFTQPNSPTHTTKALIMFLKKCHYRALSFQPSKFLFFILVWMVTNRHNTLRQTLKSPLLILPVTFLLQHTSNTYYCRMRKQKAIVPHVNQTLLTFLRLQFYISTHSSISSKILRSNDLKNAKHTFTILVELPWIHCRLPFTSKRTRYFAQSQFWSKAFLKPHQLIAEMHLVCWCHRLQKDCKKFNFQRTTRIHHFEIARSSGILLFSKRLHFQQ